MENIFSKQVGERIADARAAMKMTQAELARGMSERLGKDVRPLTVTRLEGGKRPIVIDELKAAAETLRVSVADLIAVDDDLDFEYLAAVLAAEEKSRAKYKLSGAVREWLGAETYLNKLIESKTVDLKQLPTVTQMFVSQMYRTSFDQVVNDSKREWTRDHGSDA